METAIVVVSTVIAVGASLYMLAMNNIQDLKDNWVTYRCNPAYMPLAGLVGKDPFKNFTDCTMKSFQDYTSFVVDPIMSQFSTMTDAVSQIGGAMDDMRGMMSDVRNGFLGIVGTVFGKIHNLLSQFQYIIIRMRTLMARLVGIMMAFVHIFSTGSQTGTSVMNGPIGKTMNFLCFDPETQIELENGVVIRIADVVLGMKLKNGASVTSVYTLDGTGVDMYNIDGVVVSGSHRILYGGKYIKTRFHPLSKPVNSLPLLTCINTSNHKIVLNNSIFLDFVENTDPDFIEIGRNLTEMYYNRKCLPDNRIKNNNNLHATGFLANTIVLLQNSSVPISDVKVGDILSNGEMVRGVVKHSAHAGLFGKVDEGIYGHLGSWVFQDGNIWTVESYGDIRTGDVVFYNLITSSSKFNIASSSGVRQYTVLDELESSHWFFERFKNRTITSVE